LGSALPTPQYPPGKPFSGAAANPVQIRINNMVLTPAFSAITSAGLYQFNLVQLPTGLGTGDVSLQANGRRRSNAVRRNLAPIGRC
jgi:uncharacterized protein (TIGR03437 family)